MRMCSHNLVNQSDNYCCAFQTNVIINPGDEHSFLLTFIVDQRTVPYTIGTSGATSP